MDRRITAILAADVAGYSRLMGEDQVATIDALRQLRRDIFEPVVASNAGTIVKRLGDGWIVEFPSITDAVACALAIQDSLAGHDRIKLRIGIHIGEVAFEDEDVFGDGVNVASRLEVLAAPGEILLSDIAYHSLDGQAAKQFGGGEVLELKNIARPVSVWRWPQTPVSHTTTGDAHPSRTRAEAPSIAVLPFTNLSHEPEQEFFADGVTEDIITGLSRFRSLFVIARNSSFSYKGISPDVREVARDLGVRYVLEGSVRRSGERIRVTGQLVEANSGKQLWAERYDRELGDVFALQDEITAAIISAIAPEIDEAERMLARSRPPGSLDVWSRFQLGLSAAYMTSKEALEAAVTQLDQVNVLDPNFAPAFAYGVVARIRLMRHIVGFNEELVRQAHDKARAGVALDPGNPDCLMALCRVYLELGQYELAIAKAEEVLSLNPNSASANHLLGYSLSRSGRPEDAISHLDRAIQLSPRDIAIGGFYGVKAVALFHLGLYQESADWGQRSINSPNPRPIAFLYLFGALIKVERAQEAAVMLPELMRLKPDLALSEMREKIEHDYSRSGDAIEILFTCLRDLDLPK